MSPSPRIAAALGDRYVIEREIGSGGMAVVYLAVDRKLEREVALKVLRPELGAVLGSERFLAEVKISARLDHPHILTLIDSGSADGLLYYVLPFVRGESLRTKLTREKQLGLEEALTITKQVASALDYAHRQGLVHRDIKPENILLQEGEAMLTDFGIALAVTEAGGNRLTETGLSLGTPQYMSPEQATGDRGIDARSDVYSLASVLYEMLAGEPPVTGVSAQAMIAKLMTEKPTHLRVLRDAVPESVDAAVTKALSKTPADRFSSAGEFAKALDLHPAHATTTGVATAATPARRSRAPFIGAAVAILAAAGVVFGMRGKGSQPSDARAILGQKRQLTLSGRVFVPAISPDGKQLAYLTRKCGAGVCNYSLIVQDVGGSTTRTIFSDATSGYTLEWSPDRRNLIFNGTIGGHLGTYLVSALGGPPRFLTPGVATFYAGGDSLLIGPSFRPDSAFWVRVAALDGIARDSIRVVGTGQALAALSNVPGTTWIVTLILQEPHGLWQVIDRSGKVADRVVNACTCGGIATTDAVWLARAGHSEDEAVVRIAIDRATGHLSSRQDTMASGLFTQFSLVGDGSAMVMDEGTNDFSVWALDVSDVLKGRYPDDRLIAHASNRVSADISADGARLLVRRTVPSGQGRAELRYSIVPFTGGSETPLAVTGEPVYAFWTDSVTVATATQTPTGLRLAQLDVRTNAQRNVLDLPDSAVQNADALPDGWAWIPSMGDRVIVRSGGQSREIKPPSWFAFVYSLDADPSKQRLFVQGYNKSTGDTLGLALLSLADGSMTQWTSMFAERATITPLSDGSVFIAAAESQGFLTFYRATGPGKLQKLGVSARPMRAMAVSRDFKRAVVTERDYRADAWMSQVVKR